MRALDFVQAVIEEIDEAMREGFDLQIELTRVMSTSKIDGEPMIVRLDFPIVGIARREGDLLLVIEAAPEMIAFGKDIRRLDGEPVTIADAGGPDAFGAVPIRKPEGKP